MYLVRAPEWDEGSVQLLGLGSTFNMVCRFSGACGGYADQGSEFSFRCSFSQRVCRHVSGGVARDTSGEAGRVSDRLGVGCGPYRQGAVSVGTARNSGVVVIAAGTARQAIYWT